MQVIVNGQPREAGDDVTVANLLAELQLNVRQVAVELNRELVPRTQHAERKLAPGDRVEVVTLVGGG